MRAVVLVYFAIVIAIIIGWFMNLFQVIEMGSQTITGLFLLKCIGVVVAPLGAILGFMG